MGCVSSKKKLSKSDLEFLEENTEFSKDQIVEWYEGFIVSIKSKWNMQEKVNEKKTSFSSYTHQTIIWFIGTVKLLFLLEAVLAAD
jgi:hypothetical protein